MPAPNPYATPETQNETAQPPVGPSELRSVRTIFYVHLVAILICAFLTLLDTRQIIFPAVVKQAIGPLLYVIVFPAVFSWLGCPIAMSIAVSRLNHRSIGYRLEIFAADLGLSVFQIWVLLPGVQ